MSCKKSFQLRDTNRLGLYPRPRPGVSRNSTRMSTSLSGPVSSRATEPNNASEQTPNRSISSCRWKERKPVPGAQRLVIVSVAGPAVAVTPGGARQAVS